MQKRQHIYQYVRNRERQEGQKKKWMFFSWVCELDQLSKQLNQQHRGSSPCADREEKSESSTLQCCRSACPTSVKPVNLHRLSDRNSVFLHNLCFMQQPLASILCKAWVPIFPLYLSGCTEGPNISPLKPIYFLLIVMVLYLFFLIKNEHHFTSLYI